jgi:hypothetical protein
MDQKYLCEFSLSHEVERVALLRQIKARDGVMNRPRVSRNDNNYRNHPLKLNHVV